VIDPMPRRAVVLLSLTLALASCGGPAPSELSSSSSVTSSQISSPSAGSAVRPGRPYDAASLLTAMRESRRPGGVPDELETDAIGAALSEQVWTWDGRPWTTMSIGGACGPSSCTLDVAGSRDGAAGSDLYSFAVAADGEVTLVTADLHAYDASLDRALERAALGAAADQLAGLAYVGASWLPPPDTGRYWVAYRSGGEEGAPGLDLLLDLATGRILDSRRV
jgi:hypothetical protein